MKLTEYVQSVSLEDFGRPFTHQVQWNSRLRTTGGRFFPKDDLDLKRVEKSRRSFALRRLCAWHEVRRLVEGLRAGAGLEPPVHAQTPVAARLQDGAALGAVEAVGHVVHAQVHVEAVVAQRLPVGVEAVHGV